MSVWKQIDEMKSKHDSEMRAASNGVEGEGGVKGSVRCDEFGRWHCRYIPRGERAHAGLDAMSGAELVRKMKAVRANENAPKTPTK